MADPAITAVAAPILPPTDPQRTKQAISEEAAPGEGRETCRDSVPRRASVARGRTHSAGIRTNNYPHLFDH